MLIKVKYLHAYNELIGLLIQNSIPIKPGHMQAAEVEDNPLTRQLLEQLKDIYKDPKIVEEVKLITNVEYNTLKDPEFIGQSRPNDEGIYFIDWRSEDVLYRTMNNLFT